jgi:hypothetical protein
VASRDFLGTLSQIYKSRDVEVVVKTRLKDLFVSWYRRFADSKDILPGFSDLYLQLKLASDAEGVEVRPAAFGQARQETSKRLPDGKADKLRKDLQVVKDNVSLTHDMILARENPNSETLNELVTTLKAMEGKILKLVERLEDADVLEYCLNVKDELQDVLRKFEEYKSGKIFNIAQKWGIIDEPLVNPGIADLLFESPSKPVESSFPASGLNFSGSPVKGSSNIIPSDNFDSLFSANPASNNDLIGSAFATNESVQNPVFSSAFNSQPLSQGPFFAGDSGSLGGFGGKELLGLNLTGFNTTGVPQGTSGTGLSMYPASNHPPQGPFVGVNFNSSNQGFSGQVPPNFNGSQSVPGQNFPGQSASSLPNQGGKVNMNYKPSEHFDDPFSSSINTNVRSNQARSPKSKEKNFDELFDFKF